MESNALSSSPLPPDAVVAIERGDLIVAIKLVREHTGLGLKESKEAVDRYQAGDRFPLSAASVPHADPFTAVSGVSFAGYAFPAAAIDAIRQGHKVEAIKLLREAYTSLGLAQAKDLVDAYARQPGSPRPGTLGIGHPPASPGDPMAEPGRVPRSSWGSRLFWIAAILLALLGAWSLSGRP